MGYEREFTAEIDAILDQKQAAGEQMVAQWITQEICQGHEKSLPSNGDEFWRYCGYQLTRAAVRRRINARAGDRKPDDDNRQGGLFPGYMHVQAYYVVKRRGVGDVGVPLDQMTDAEVKAKMGLYNSFGVAALAHSDELSDYLKKRRADRRKRTA